MNLTKEYIDGLIEKAHTTAVEKGFWESDRDIFESANLINTEVAEMVEELRSGHEVEETYFNAENPTKPEGFPVELADYAIRCADLAGSFGGEFGSDSQFLIDFVSCNKFEGGLQEAIFSLTKSVVEIVECEESYKAHTVVLSLVLAHMIASHLSIDLPAVIEQKMAYNATRTAKHGRKF